MTFLLLSLAGGLGAVLRFVTDAAVTRRVHAGIPLGTPAVNILGSFVLGCVTGLVGRHLLPPDVGRVLGTGLCGGFTTFSTAAVETARLQAAERPAAMSAYLVANLLGSVVAAALGMGLAALL